VRAYPFVVTIAQQIADSSSANGVNFSSSRATEPLPIIAVRIAMNVVRRATNPGRNTAQTPSDFAQLVGGDFPFTRAGFAVVPKQSFLEPPPARKEFPRDGWLDGLLQKICLARVSSRRAIAPHYEDREQDRSRAHSGRVPRQFGIRAQTQDA
jgi:hypothetical protein